MVVHQLQSDDSSSGNRSNENSAKESLKKLSISLLGAVQSLRHHNEERASRSATTSPVSVDSSETSASDPLEDSPHREEAQSHISDETRIFALIVGIDDYESKSVSPLRGCKNDAEDFIRLLRNDLGVPEERIAPLFNERATRYAILNSFKNHLCFNLEIKNGDVIVFYFSGHGTSAVAPNGWLAENGRVELLCPFDYDREREVHGIPDYTLNALMETLKREKGDNIIAVLDCCHSGGMDREQFLDDSRVRGIRDIPDAEPLPSTLDHDILFPSPANASCEQPEVKPFRARATYVTLAACSSKEQAKEKLCRFIPSVGSSPVEETRGIFSVNLISILRSLGRDGMKAWSYSHLMTELSRRGNFSSSLPSLSSQNPECKGRHKNRAFFGKREPVDVPESFALVKDGSIWHVQAGAVHGVILGTEFGLTRAAIQRMGLTEDVVLRSTRVEALRCQVESLSRPLPDTLDHSRVVVARWGCSHPLMTKVSIRGVEPSSAVHRTHSTASEESFNEPLYHQVVPESTPHDLLVDISRTSGTVSRIERLDPLVARFCSTTRVHNLSVTPEDARLHPTRVLTYISRFNFHLYRLNTTEGIDKSIKVASLFHVVERALAEVSSRYKRPDTPEPSTYPYELLHRATSFLAHSSSDTVHQSRNARGSSLPIPGQVKEVVLTPRDEHFYGLTLVNDSQVDLFPYVFYFNPDTYAITPVYISESATVAPLPKKGHLPIGYGGSPTEPMSFRLPENSSHNHLGFLKVFVTTRHVDFNIEQPAIFDPPVGRMPSVDGPPVRGARLTPILPLDGWNAWIYALTSKAAKKHTL